MNNYPPRKLPAGTTVVVPQFGREAAGVVVAQQGLVTVVRLAEGRNAGRTLEFYTHACRVPAAFEALADRPGPFPPLDDDQKAREALGVYLPDWSKPGADGR